jgi:teichuronic acid exporter
MITKSLPLNVEVDQNTLKNDAARSFKWAFLYNVVPRVITPFSTVILAVLLSPDDFGLIAVFSLIVAFARILVEMGLGKAVIQRKDRVDEAASISFWVCLIISIFCYGILWVLAPSIAILYAHEKMIAIIRISSFALPISALSTIPKALLRREMKFRDMFWINTSFMVGQAVLSVIFAFLQWGVWAVVWGQLIGMMISTILAWFFVKWHPKLLMGLSLLGTMLKFSLWVMVSGFQDWAFQYADNAIAGIFLGVQGLGIYSLGFNFATIIPGFFTSALSDVAYPSFCKLQEYPEQIGANLLKLQELTSAVLFPFAFGFSALAPIIIDLFYGNKWAGLDFVISALVIMPGLGYVWALNEFAYQAIGKPQIWTKLSGLSLLLLVPMLWFSAPLGLTTFTYVRFAGAWILPIGNFFVGSRCLGIRVKEQFKAILIPLFSSLIMYVVIFLLKMAWDPFVSWAGWGKVIVIGLIGGGIYITAIFITKKELLFQLLGSFKNILS